MSPSSEPKFFGGQRTCTQVSTRERERWERLCAREWTVGRLEEDRGFGRWVQDGRGVAVLIGRCCLARRLCGWAPCRFWRLWQVSGHGLLGWWVRRGWAPGRFWRLWLASGHGLMGWWVRRVWWVRSFFRLAVGVRWSCVLGLGWRGWIWCAWCPVFGRLCGVLFVVVLGCLFGYHG